MQLMRVWEVATSSNKPPGRETTLYFEPAHILRPVLSVAHDSDCKGTLGINPLPLLQAAMRSQSQALNARHRKHCSPVDNLDN